MKTFTVRQMQRDFFNLPKDEPFVVVKQVWAPQPGTKKRLFQIEPLFIIEPYREDHPLVPEWKKSQQEAGTPASQEPLTERIKRSIFKK